ncbi:type III pantothenate kinase [Mycoplasmopsis ciconiae]|uniref:Type III pantothenate kinase n=1 Tax=Mycoplasmopsis ciconiae TaxID=561067 RepID=A0ABU7MMB4_9BACT|nr:type III pantothenate kinase [Mycoplasmopsis ciconiae]
MSRVVVIDGGNTFLKVAHFEDDQIKFIKEYKNTAIQQDMSILFNDLNHFCNQCTLVYGSVNNYTNQLIDIIKQKYNFKNYFEINSQIKLNFEIDKQINKNKVGVDILGGCAYAAHLNKNALVFLLGTAMVGIFVQNNVMKLASIAPGAGSSVNHLISKADGLKHLEFDYQFNKQMGANTLDSIKSGYFHILNGFILSLKDYINTEFDQLNYSTFISGGDVKNIQIQNTQKIENIVIKGYFLLYKLNNL